MKLCAFDTETTGLNPWGTAKYWGFHPARPFAFSFCRENGSTSYFRFNVDPLTREVLYRKAPHIWDRLVELLSDPKTCFILQNASFDLRMLRLAGLPVPQNVRDTLPLSHVVTGGAEMSYSLKPMAAKFLGITDADQRDLKASVQKARAQAKKLGWKIATEETHGKDPAMADFWLGDRELCKKYAVQDAERTMLLYKFMLALAKEDPRLMATFEREMSLQPAIRRMEDRGTRVFPKAIRDLRKYYTDYMAKQYKVAEQLSWPGINLRSPLQLIKVLSERHELVIPEGKKQPSVNGEVMQSLAEGGDLFAEAVLEYRNAAHAVSGFMDPYDRYRVPEGDGVMVLHPNIRQVGPITGRMACTEPNLMQVADEETGRRRSKITMKPRECFGPREGHAWYLFDYSQIEVWLFAFLSESKDMMDALLSGHDFHGTLSKRVFGSMPDFLTRPDYYRKLGKLIVFCKLYGGGTKKVSIVARISVNEAQDLVARFDDELPIVKKYIKRMSTMGARHGEIWNPYGRKYVLTPGFEYRAANYSIQGTAADVFKTALILVDDMFQKKYPKQAHLLLPIHDEIVTEVQTSAVGTPADERAYISRVTRCMQAALAPLSLPKPIPVGVKVVRKLWSQPQKVDL